MFGLIALLGKKAGDLSDSDLLDVAKAVSGGEPADDSLYQLLQAVKSAEPGTPVTELLRSPTAIKVLQAGVAKLKAKSESEPNGIFCQCPVCATRFIADI